ncbi:MAG: 16S rRNA (cytosine(1402)-N(4))-methyltransferase RsmH [Bacteroidaceae bacterium]|nr:16S rRNA (cytosine(1402)-N(4))-methyltransferase RsmH [Bacteroidaceae bacterium]
MIKDAGSYHIPVLLQECIDGLSIRPDGVYVDVTFGGGGHSRAILSALGEKGHLYGFDQDSDAINNVPVDSRFTFVHSNFRYLKNWMRYHGVEQLDGLLADLGVSSHHFDEAGRGFSFRQDGPLDMRMNRQASLSAKDVIQTYNEKQLAQIFYLYGELRNARQLAAAIVRNRNIQPINTIDDFIKVVNPLMGKSREKKDLAKVFQALRIEVNHELEALCEMLGSAIDLLKPGGRLVVLTYHSLEDRIVKNFMRAGNVDGKADKDFYGNLLSPLKPVNNKVILPDAAEEERNPRSRSAKLRIAERLNIES